MHAEEIEAWYEEEKTRLTEEFYAKVKKKGNSELARIQKEFDPKFKKLVERYNDLHGRRFKQEDAKKRLDNRVNKVRESLRNFLKKRE